MKLFTGIVLFFVSYTATAQDTKKTDSLLAILAGQKENVHRVHTLISLAETFCKSNPAQSITYAEAAESLAEKLQLEKELEKIYLLSLQCRSKGSFGINMSYLVKLAALYDKQNNKSSLAGIYIEMANSFVVNGMIANSRRSLDSAEKIILELKDTAALCRLYTYRGTLFDHGPRYDSALYYYEKGLRLARKINNRKSIFHGLKNMAVTYNSLGQTELSMQYFDTILSMMDTSIYSPDDPAQVYHYYGKAFVRSGNYPKAETYINKSIRIASQTGNVGLEYEGYLVLSEIYGLVKNFRLQTIHLNKYYRGRDSLMNIDVRNQLTQLEAGYQLEKTNALLALQTTQTLKRKSERNFFILVAAGISVLLLALAFFYGRIKKGNDIIQEQNLEISRQKETLQGLNQAKDRLFGIISYDLKRPLVNLKDYLLMTDDQTLSPEKKESLKQLTSATISHTTEMLDNLLIWATMQLKNVVPGIQYVNLEDCIENALDSFRETAKQKNIFFKKDIQLAGYPSDPDILEIALRNILSNAVKFSPAGSPIFITTFSINKKAVVEIKDNGPGMSQACIKALQDDKIDASTNNQSKPGQGIGIFITRSLLQKINARLTIQSEENKGTTVCIELL